MLEFESSPLRNAKMRHEQHRDYLIEANQEFWSCGAFPCREFNSDYARYEGWQGDAVPKENDDVSNPA